MATKNQKVLVSRKYLDELEHCTHFLKSLLKNSKMAITVADPKGNITYFSKGAQKLTGYKTKEVKGKPISMFYPDKKEPKMIWSKLNKEGVLENYRTEILTKKNKIVPISIFISKIVNSKGSVLGSIGASVDISDRLLVEEQLKTERDFSQNLIRTLGSIVVVLDRMGRIVIFNNTAEKLTGYKAKEAIGKNWFKMFLPKDVKINVKKVFKDLLSGKLPSEYENPILTKKGKQRIIHWKNTFFKDAGGKIKFVIATGIDVTEIIEAKRTLEKSFEELKVIDKLKTEFIHNAAHELNSPITTLKLNLELLEPYCLGERGEERFEIISRSVNRLHKNITDLLNLAAIESGKMDYSYTKTNIKGLLTEIIDSLAPIAEKKQIEFSADLDEVTVRGDFTKLVQAFTDLIENAIKFTEKGKVTVVLKKKKRKAEVKIRDTGIGMTKQQLSKIFTRFYQADKGYPGLGIGLSIVRKIVEDQGGRVRAESRGLGRGSTFIVELPLLP
jgi:PAS domain S-box-containing protein